MGLPFRSRARSPFKSKSRRSGASPPDLRRFGKGRRRQQPAPVTILRSPGGGTSLNEHQNRARKSHPQANQWPRACGQVLPARSPWRHDRRRFPASSSFLLLHPPPRRFERTIGGIGASDVSPRSPVRHGIVDAHRAVIRADRMRGQPASDPIRRWGWFSGMPNAVGGGGGMKTPCPCSATSLRRAATTSGGNMLNGLWPFSKMRLSR
jgi:hypothetical protein